MGFITPPTVTIPLDEYIRLLNEAELLETLRAYGVDNWDGYIEVLNALEEAD